MFGGGTFPAGAEVVEGFYYDRCENNPFLYKLIPKKKRRLFTLWQFATFVLN
jgi:hypothetical protein